MDELVCFTYFPIIGKNDFFCKTLPLIVRGSWNGERPHIKNGVEEDLNAFAMMTWVERGNFYINEIELGKARNAKHW